MKEEIAPKGGREEPTSEKPRGNRDCPLRGQKRRGSLYMNRKCSRGGLLIGGQGPQCFRLFKSKARRPPQMHSGRAPATPLRGALCAPAEGASGRGRRGASSGAMGEGPQKKGARWAQALATPPRGRWIEMECPPGGVPTPPGGQKGSHAPPLRGQRGPTRGRIRPLGEWNKNK